MKNPEEQIPFDDQQFASADEQLSQQDIHSNGLNEEITSNLQESDGNLDALKQAYRAAESSFTLDNDDAGQQAMR